MALCPTVACNNILQRAFHENIPVTPMKLQKLLYFVSCEYVKHIGNELLSDDFCVWQYGPVLPTVYNEFKDFHGNRITRYAVDMGGIPHAYDETTSPNFKAAIDRIWPALKDKTGIELSTITHEDGSGWSVAFNHNRDRISKDEMRADDSYEQYL